MGILSKAPVAKTFAALNVVFIAMLAGLAVSMNLFIVPIIRDNGATSHLTVLQFNDMVNKGLKYLQTMCITQAIALATSTYLLYRNPSRDVSLRWRYFAVALFILVQVAWYETVNIFPLNDRMMEIGSELGSSMGLMLDQSLQSEVQGLMNSWQRNHNVRLALPLISSMVGVFGLI